MSAAATQGESQSLWKVVINHGSEREEVTAPLTTTEHSVLLHVEAIHSSSSGEPIIETSNPRVVIVLSQALNQVMELIKACIRDGRLTHYSAHSLPSPPASDDIGPQISWKLAINQEEPTVPLTAAEQVVLSRVKAMHGSSTGEPVVESMDPRVLYLQPQARDDIMEYVKARLHDGTLAGYQGRYV